MTDLDAPPTGAELVDLKAGVLNDIRAERAEIVADRASIKEHEAELAAYIREALGYGIGVTTIARAAGLSRERIYQIRDGRR